ncbi:hypothetical protein DFH27DRAFT_51987 [Peziza echinospora]|nr:hypothetical protein DFH27DRAFT_51987 [Peziza echinospora]
MYRYRYLVQSLLVIFLLLSPTLFLPVQAQDWWSTERCPVILDDWYVGGWEIITHFVDRRSLGNETSKFIIAPQDLRISSNVRFPGLSTSVDGPYTTFNEIEEFLNQNSNPQALQAQVCQTANGTVSINMTHIPLVTRVSLDVCSMVCGSGYYLYPTYDIWSRIMMWLLPLFLLIGNLHFAPLGFGNTCCVVAHVLGDPLDFMGSLHVRLEVGERLLKSWTEMEVMRVDAGQTHQSVEVKADTHPEDSNQIGIAFDGLSDDSGFDVGSEGEAILNKSSRSFLNITALDLATICAGYDDLGQIFCFESMVNTLQTFLRSCTRQEKYLVEKAFAEAATDLAEAWTDESFRAHLAVGGYVLAVVGSFFKTIDPFDVGNIQGSNSPTRTGRVAGINPNWNNRTSHTIAYAVSYLWVITAVILSATAGGFANRHAVEKVLTRLKNKIPRTCCLPEWEAGEGKTLARAGATGMNYGYRPRKVLVDVHEGKPDNGDEFSSSETQARPLSERLNKSAGYHLRRTLPFLSLIGATACAFWISWFTPTDGFGCRSLHQLCALILWILSSILTMIIQRVLFPPRAKAYQYACIVAKDSIVSIIQLSFLFLAFIGYFNRCRCWSGWLSLRSAASVTIYTDDIFEDRLRKLWPALAGAGVGCQFLLAAYMVWGGGRCQVFKRTEAEEADSERRMKIYQQRLDGI